GVPVGALRRGKVEDASHDMVREVLNLHTGIETDDARKMVKEIKQLKLKVQAQIMDEKLRITGKKIDDLQAVIAHLKAHGPEYPLQFINFTCLSECRRRSASRRRRGQLCWSPPRGDPNRAEA